MKTGIIYTTKYGCTAEVAKRIQAGLGGDTRLFNIMTDSTPPLDAYDTIILGGSIYTGKVQKRLIQYVNKNLQELLTKNVGLFLCAGEPNEDTRQKELQNAFPEALFQHATAKGVLGYAFQFEKMNFFEKVIMKKIKGDDVSTTVYFDDQIEQFVEAINRK